MCFGHAPNLDSLISRLAGAPRTFTELKKAGVVAFEHNASQGRWRLIWLLLRRCFATSGIKKRSALGRRISRIGWREHAPEWLRGFATCGRKRERMGHNMKACAPHDPRRIGSRGLREEFLQAVFSFALRFFSPLGYRGRIHLWRHAGEFSERSMSRSCTSPSKSCIAFKSAAQTSYLCGRKFSTV